MKPRKLLKASELPELYDKINRQLDMVGIESQQAVAARLVELVQDPEAGPVDFAKAIRNDAALCGRLLKLANSAAFAQLKEVTSVDRACMLLGLERLRSMALGFYLSRSATDPEHEELSRRIWGESVLRGCIAAELARETEGAGVPEAFLVGLLLDSGVPVANRMLKDRYDAFRSPDLRPEQRFQQEFESLPLTHVDVGSALCLRWKLPEILAKPIAWHHTPPPATPPATALQRMQRIAYCVGLVGMSDGLDAELFGCEVSARLKLSKDQLKKVCRLAMAEYKMTISLFDTVAEHLPGVGALMDQVHQRLIDSHDEDMIKAAGAGEDAIDMPARFALGGATVELERIDPGAAVAYLLGERGARVVSHHFVPGDETVDSIVAALAITPAPGDECKLLDEHLRSMAA